MKKAGILVVLLTVVCLMGGCLEETPLTDAELDVVAEYAAGLLLKYDKNYEPYLLAAEQLTPTPTEAPEVTPEAPITGTPDVDNPGTQTTITPEPTPTPTAIPENGEATNEQLTKVFGVENLSLSYDTYDLCESYNSNEYYNLGAKEGREYLVVYFLLENTSEEDQELSLSDEKYFYSLYLNATDLYRPTFTMELNDIHFLGTKDVPFVLKAGETFEAVLIFDIPNNKTVDMAHLTIMNYETDETVFIRLK